MSHIVSHVLFWSLYQSLTTTYLTMIKDKALYSEHETKKARKTAGPFVRLIVAS